MSGIRKCLLVGVGILSAEALAAQGSGHPQLDPSSMVGVWEMEGQALTMDVGREEVVYYDTTSISCIESERGPPSSLSERFAGGVVGRGAGWVELRDRYQPYRLRALPALPERCRGGGTTGADPVLNFETFLKYLVENYAGAQVRGIDWTAIRAEFRPRITPATTADELWVVYEEILGRFDDVHVFVTNGRSGSERRSISAGRASGLREALLAQNPALTAAESIARDGQMQDVLNRFVLYDVLHGRFSTALQDKFQWGWAAPRVGYLNIVMMRQLFETPATDPDQVWTAVHEVTERILREFASADALIVDVRQNRGGAAAVGLEIAAHLGDRPVVNRTRARSAAGFTRAWETRVEPHGTRFAGRVYLLISENTVSAAEQFALVMREFPNVTLVGETSRGAFSSILVKRLPDGSMLGIANEQLVNGDGENFESRGIRPDVEVPVFQPRRLVAGFRDAIDVAIRLAGQESRR